MSSNENNKEEGQRALAVTGIRSADPDRVCKTYSRRPDGRITKAAAASILKGRARWKPMDAEALADALRGVTEEHNVALMLGSFAPVAARELCVVATEKRVAEALGATVEDSPGHGIVTVDGTPTLLIARLKRLCEPSEWLLLDADSPAGMPLEWAALTLAERLARFDAILPGISAAERIEWRGSSSRVHRIGEEPGPATHGLLRISDRHKLEVLREFARVESVRAGLSFASPLFSRETGEQIGEAHRTLFDLAVWLPGRLVFVSRPDVSAISDTHAVAPADVRIVNPGGGALDVSAIELPAPPAVREYARKTGTERQATLRNGRLSVADYGTLTWATEITVRGVTKPLRAWFEDMQREGAA